MLREKADKGKCPSCGAELKRMHPAHVTMCEHRVAHEARTVLTPRPLNMAPVNTSVVNTVNTLRWPYEEDGDGPVTQDEFTDLFEDWCVRGEEIDRLKALIAEVEGKPGGAPKKSKGRPAGYHADYMRKKRAAAKEVKP